MSKISVVKSHLSKEELNLKINKVVGFWRIQKWLIIYNAINYPRKAIEISNHLAVSESLVHKTISEYNKFGAKAIDTQGKGGRRNSYLTLDQEKEFISAYIERAKHGHIATANEIRSDFEKKVNKKVNKTSIYRLLERHNWRKIVPMPYHPKQDKELQETFKKTLDMK